MTKKTKQLLQENNRLEQLLSAEHQEVLTDMVCYLRGANLTMTQQEQVRSDITSMLWEAQQRGESLSQVIGDDPQAFCDEVIAALPPQSFRNRLLHALSTLCLAFCVVLGINFITSAVEMIAKGTFPYLSISLGKAIGTVLIVSAAYAVVELICRHSFEKTGKGPLAKGNRGIFFLLVGAFILNLILYLFVKITLFSISIYWGIALIAALFIGYKATEYFAE